MTLGKQLGVFRTETQQEFARLDVKIDEVEARLDAKIDGFQTETREEFARLDAKIDKVDARLDAKIDGFQAETRQEFARLDAKIDGVETRLDAKIDGVESTLRVLIEATHAEVVKVADAVVHVSERLDRSDAKQDARHVELLEFMRDVVGNHEVRIQALERSASPW